VQSGKITEENVLKLMMREEKKEGKLTLTCVDPGHILLILICDKTFEALLRSLFLSAAGRVVLLLSY
jgi:hypothetical protein